MSGVEGCCWRQLFDKFSTLRQGRGEGGEGQNLNCQMPLKNSETGCFDALLDFMVAGKIEIIQKI